MTTAVFGATGRAGSEIVRGVLARRQCGRRAGSRPRQRPPRLRRTRRVAHPSNTPGRPGDLTEALDGIRTVFIAMGSIGVEGVLQRIAINAATGISSIEQLTRLSVLNT